MNRLLIAPVALLTTALLAPCAQAEVEAPPRWQARLQLNSLDTRLDTSPRLGGSRLLSANLLGDYYLTSSGSASLTGGLRATGGLMLGPLSISQSSAGLALGSPRFAIGQRQLAVAGPDTAEASASLSYLGIGYTGRLHGSGLSFSADLGLMAGSFGPLRLGRSSAQGFEEAMRDLRFKPLLQLGLAYSY